MHFMNEMWQNSIKLHTSLVSFITLFQFRFSAHEDKQLIKNTMLANCKENRLVEENNGEGKILLY
jgi:hypothetical protein